MAAAQPSDLPKEIKMHDPTTSDGEQSPLTVIQSVTPPFIPQNAEVMTVIIEWPAGSPGAPPHRHPGGPAFGYVLEGEMLFELEGEAPRVVTAGEAFWEPGGDVIHYSDANNRDDGPLRFVVNMLCVPGQPMLVYVEPDELERLEDRRVPRALG
jgi:quercetin dioxygenase-like cupin family protein